MKVEIINKAAVAVKNAVGPVVGKAGLIAKKASPTVMLAAGGVGIVAAGVWACVNSYKKLPDIVKDSNGELDAVDVNFEKGTPEYKKATTKSMIRTTGKVVRIYSGPIILGTVSLGLIVGSHVVLNRRYLGAAAAYKAVDEAYKTYRNRVKDILGEEAENDIYTGKSVSKKNKDAADDSADAVITPDGITLNPDFHCSPYARFFDENSIAWKKNPEYNMLFLRNQQNFANDLLHSRGHVFLNEVYDCLGIPRSRAGAVVGWIMDGDGDNYITFGLDNINPSEGVRDFVNGYERSVLLDFNVDGIIYDKI